MCKRICSVDRPCSQHALGGSRGSVSRSVTGLPGRGVWATAARQQPAPGKPHLMPKPSCPCLLLQGGAWGATESLSETVNDGRESGVRAGNTATSCSGSQIRSELCVCEAGLPWAPETPPRCCRRCSLSQLCLQC